MATAINLHDRHRRFQLVISLGTLACAALSLTMPDLTHVSVLANVMVNMIWIWE